MSENKLEICPECEQESDYIYDFAYYMPFETEPSWKGRLCERCADDSDISYCEDCGRDVYNQSGYRTNTRYDEEAECMICVACLQKEWFEKGMDKFGEGDWFNDADLRDNGFSKYYSIFCREKHHYEKCKEDFKFLQEKYGKAIVSIERSGMGFEHHIALWYKND